MTRFGVGVWLQTAVLSVGVLLSFHVSAEGATLREQFKQRLEQRRVAQSRSADPDPLHGTHEYALEQKRLQRRYLVHVPKGYDAARPVPVVLAFHGGGGDAGYMVDDDRYGLIAKSEEAGFVLVVPNGFSRFPRDKLATWNAGECCGGARDNDVDDVGLVRAILEQLKARVNIDPARIFATGMSNGAMLAHRLACEMADVFSAVVTVAGTDATRRCAPARPVSVLHIHARNDDHVLFEGGAGPGAFRDKTKVTSFISVPETIARWRTRNQCGTTPRRTLSVPGAYCERYDQCADGVHVELCVTETGGHSWPGARAVRRGQESASQAISANDLMWAFFSANAR